MNILITGASGLVGSTLIPALNAQGHRTLALVRRAPKTDDEIAWNPADGAIDAARMENIDAVVHLAGENIAAGRWTQAQKDRIRSSRVEGTRLLSETLAKLKTPPKALVTASAVGYYGDRGEETLTEDSPPGAGFLPDVSIAWETAAKPAEQAGIRTVYIRIGIVLTPKGGALGKMLLPFKLGLAGVVGSGAQYMSWIALDDLIAVFVHALENSAMSGPVNATAPHPVTNREFTKTLGRVLGRPTIFPLPAFAARLALGEMADALLLSGARALPARLQDAGFSFAHPHLEGTLRHMLGK